MSHAISDWEFLRSNGWHQDEDADWCLFRTNMKHLTARSTREAIEMQLRISVDSSALNIVPALGERVAAHIFAQL